MNVQQNGLKKPGNHARVPGIAQALDSAIALVLLALSIYHFTQPGRAWRSGITELVCFAALLAAAFLVPRVFAIALNLAMAVVVAGLGVRHLISVKGWRSGIVELFFVLLLLAVAYIIYRDKGKSGASS